MHASIASTLLSVRHLSMTGPGGLKILDDISFDIAPGEIVAVVGESGSGKTMAARAVLQLLPRGITPTQGEVLLNGHDVLTMTQQEMRAVRGGVAGMVFQEPMVSLNPAMTIGAQLAEGLMLHEKITAAQARERAIAMLKRVQIADPEGCLAAFPHQFSGGMRQRIMLASVMLLKPKLLIADEPTTALDTLTQREVLETMVELTRSVGTAVMLITHNLGLVAQYAQRVVVLQRGRMVEEGTVEQVLRRPREAYTRALIDALPKRDDSRSAIPEGPPLIEARDIAVDYPGSGGLFSSAPAKRAVDGVSLAIRPGEAVAVVGGSGSGKTTLGRALIGLLPLAQGRINFRGEAVQTASMTRRREFRLACQLVFQDPYSSLDPRMTIGQIVGEPLRHAPELSRDEKRAKVAGMLSEVGLDGFAERFPHALSGGQRQRVAIARAVIRNPAFVVADEPVSALDMTIQKQILALFRRLQEKHRFACLFISHDLAAVSQLADRIAVMQDGRIVEKGSVSDIFDRPQQAYTKALLEAAPGLEHFTETGTPAVR